MKNLEAQVAPKWSLSTILRRKLRSSIIPIWVLLLVPIIVTFLLLRGYGTHRLAIGGIERNSQGQEVSVLDELRAKHLFPYDPSYPTNYSQPTQVNKDWKDVMPNIIAERLNYKMNGFFIECGALDGVFLSNTLLLERTYGWSGLLVEADPKYASILKSRNRYAWVADVCLSPQPFPIQVDMIGHKSWGGMSYSPNDVVRHNSNNPADYTRKFRVDCFPLGMLLDAVNRTEVDYFSLDVEGMELDILKTIPFDRIHIKLISLEVRPQTQKKLQNFLEPLGYKKIKHIRAPSDYMMDDLYELTG